ncbi:MAG: cupin domain-containing protein [Acidobacteria bacterium]|nr:cupin domain-containing protein [Acidobacteriota bacterium]
MTSQYRVERWNEPYAPDVASLRSRLTAEGYSVFQWTDLPGAEYPQHAHANDQTHWVVSGEIELEVAGAGKSILAAGDRDFMPSGTEHTARVIGDVPVIYLIGEKV